MTTICVTGHRPDKLGGYCDSTDRMLFAFAKEVLSRVPRENLTVITGMALGWDIAIAEACHDGGIPFIAAVPCEEQEKLWASHSQQKYYDLLLKAKEIKVVSEGPFAYRKMQIRNEWMVDHSKAVIALWDGSSGGTKNCVDYVNRKGVPMVNMWDEWIKFQGKRITS